MFYPRLFWVPRKGWATFRDLVSMSFWKSKPTRLTLIIDAELDHDGAPLLTLAYYTIDVVDGSEASGVCLSKGVRWAIAHFADYGVTQYYTDTHVKYVFSVTSREIEEFTRNIAKEPYIRFSTGKQPRESKYEIEEIMQRLKGEFK